MLLGPCITYLPDCIIIYSWPHCTSTGWLRRKVGLYTWLFFNILCNECFVADINMIYRDWYSLSPSPRVYLHISFLDILATDIPALFSLCLQWAKIFATSQDSPYVHISSFISLHTVWMAKGYYCLLEWFPFSIQEKGHKKWASISWKKQNECNQKCKKKITYTHYATR